MEQRSNDKADVAEYFSLADELLSICKSYRGQIVIDKSQPQKVHAAGFFAKLLRDVEAAVLLLRRGMVSQARSLLRVAIECEILLAKSCESPKFVEAYRLANERERLRLGSGVQRITPGAFDDVKEFITEERVKALKETLKGVEYEHLDQWASDVGLGDAYQTGYRLFGRDVHAGAFCLISFLKYAPSGDPYEVNWCPQKDFRLELTEASRIVISALSRIGDLFGLSAHEDFAGRHADYHRLAKLAVIELGKIKR